MAGSPTLLINGVDPFAVRGHCDCSVSCRRYRDERGRPYPRPASNSSATRSQQPQEPTPELGGMHYGRSLSILRSRLPITRRSCHRCAIAHARTTRTSDLTRVPRDGLSSSSRCVALRRRNRAQPKHTPTSGWLPNRRRSRSSNSPPQHQHRSGDGRATSGETLMGSFSTSIPVVGRGVRACSWWLGEPAGKATGRRSGFS